MVQRATTRDGGEDGYLLLGAIVAIFLVLLALSVAAPIVAKDLRRERELETVRRGNQYVRALQLYYRKFHSYPGSMDALEKSNNIRFLRQKYVDPMTGKSDWRMIRVGENKTTVKGFFGKPLAGLPGAGLGSAAGMASSGQASVGATSGSAFGSSGSSSFGSNSLGSSSNGLGSSGSSSLGSSSFGSSPTASPGSSTAPGAATPAGSTAAGTSTDASGGAAGATGNSMGSLSTSSIGGAFMGVGVPKTGDSVMTLNEQTTYQTWEFLYDPRIELLKAQASLFGGAPSTSAGSLGSASGMNSGIGGLGTPTTGAGAGAATGFGTSTGTGTTGTGTTGTGTGTTGTGTTGTGTTTPPQQ